MTALSGVSADTLAFHHETFIFDCLALYYVLDDTYAQRALGAGVNAVNVTFAAEDDWDATVRNLELGLEKIERSPFLQLAVTAEQILAARAAGKLAVVPGTQGSKMLEERPERLQLMHRLGIRFFGLAYTGPTLFADGCGERRDAGVSSYGVELIAAINELPMILDLSHCGHRTRKEGAAMARAPVCTHSNAYALNANDRNTHDETALAIAAKGGVMGICGLPKSVKPVDPTVADMLDHCDHYRKLIGDQSVGIGLDFTEGLKEARKPAGPASVRWRTLRPDIFGTVDEFFTVDYPKGLSGISELPNFTQGLFDRGCTSEQVAAIMGGNWLKAFQRFVG